MDVESREGMTDQLSLFGEEAVVRHLGGGEAGSRSAPTGERQASSASEGNRALVTDTLMERICEPKNLNWAYRRVKANRGSPGVDGMTVGELRAWLAAHKEEFIAQLLDGSYRPREVRGVEIPKPGGGVRQLGIPTVVDRLVQQAILQVLDPLLDPTFSESSYGFRPGRSAHQALLKASEYVAEGHTIVVDMDLEKFFDRVNHDVLMGRLARRIDDKRLLSIVRRFLEAGIMRQGVVVKRSEGTPQSGPLSPLLANLLLDEVDKELERRGHRFCRYADDLNVYVRSKVAGAPGDGFAHALRREAAPVAREPDEERGSPCAGTQVPWLPTARGREAHDCTAEPDTCQGQDPGDHTPQPGHQVGADDLGVEPVPARVGDILPLCQREGAPRADGQVDPAEAALCAAEATETGLVSDRVSGWLGGPALAGTQAGRERSRLVVYGREPAGERSHE